MLRTLLSDFKSLNLSEMRFPGFLDKRAGEIEICVNNVSKGKGWYNVEKCPLCGSTNREVIFKRFGKDILQCLDCTLGYVHEFPVDTADVYSGEEYAGIAQSDYLDNVEYRKERFGRERIGLIRQFLPSDRKNPRLLDSGCGTGWFLEVAAENGFNIAGQEFGRDLANYTSQKLGIQVWSCSLPEIPIDEKFDVITMFDVIEHVPDPFLVIRSIYERLSPGGIALFFTPNLDSLGFWKLKDQSSLVMPAEHLYHFTRSSLETALTREGFNVVHYESKGMDIPDLYSFYKDKTDQDQVARFLADHCDVLQALVDASGHANHMRFIVQR